MNLPALSSMSVVNPATVRARALRVFTAEMPPPLLRDAGRPDGGR